MTHFVPAALYNYCLSTFSFLWIKLCQTRLTILGVSWVRLKATPSWEHFFGIEVLCRRGSIPHTAHKCQFLEHSGSGGKRGQSSQSVPWTRHFLEKRQGELPVDPLPFHSLLSLPVSSPSKLFGEGMEQQGKSTICSCQGLWSGEWSRTTFPPWLPVLALYAGTALKAKGLVAGEL